MFTPGRRSLLAVILTVLLALVAPSPATSAPMSTLSDSALRTRLLYFQRADRDLDRTFAVQAMAARSDFEADLWRNFLSAWDAANTAQVLNYSPPKGLPSQGHVFVVLGASLSSTGKLTTQLTNRLKVAAKALAAYPDSRVLVSGGAPKNGHTEAERMREWLIANGIAADRIITEAKSSSTVGNATYSMALLKADPSLTSYSLISDASHLRRAGVLFNAAVLNICRSSGKPWPIRQLANVAYKDKTITNPPSDDTTAVIASNVASLLGLSSGYGALVAAPPAQPVFSALTLRPAKTTYPVGGTLQRADLSATAVYDQGSLDVSAAVKVSGFTTTKVGTPTVTVSYNDGAVHTATYPVTVVKALAKATVALSTKKAHRNKTAVKLTARFTTATKVKLSGTVGIYVGSKLVKKVHLKASAKGVVHVTLPKFAKTGTRKIIVKYAGSSTVAKAGAQATVKVVKH